MSNTLTDSAAELLTGLVRDERRDVQRGYTVYPDRDNVLEILDQAEQALTGEAGLTAAAIELIIGLAREERAQVYSGHVSYGPADADNESAGEELTEAIEALGSMTEVTA